MGLFDRIEKMAQTMKWYDFSLFKLSMFFWVFFLLGIWPALDAWTSSVAWYWWLALGIITAIPLWKKML